MDTSIGSTEYISYALNRGQTGWGWRIFFHYLEVLKKNLQLIYKGQNLPTGLKYQVGGSNAIS
jgi:hypothetical protein